MPLVYDIQCTACGCGPAFAKQAAAKSISDGQSGGVKFLPDDYAALKLENGEFVCLPHPGEMSALEEHGITWQQAMRQDRLFRVTFKVCEQCGLIHEEVQAVHRHFWGEIALIVFGVLIFILRFVFRSSWWISILVGFFGALGMVRVLEVIKRSSRRKANQVEELKECSGCVGRAFLTFPKADGKLLPCTFCGTRNLKFTNRSIS